MVGAGGYGEVYKARWRGTEVGVKKLLKKYINNDEQKQAFTIEADIMSKLRHPNLVLFMAACIKDENVCIITEFCDNGSLDQFIFEKKFTLDWKKKKLKQPQMQLEV